MSDTATYAQLSREDIEDILAVTRALAEPFDLDAMLAAVGQAACRVLHAERSAVWLLDGDAGELVLKVGSNLAAVRIPAHAGLVGECVRSRLAVNVPDCYADARFDPSMDKRTGYHTRCILSVPLIDHAGTLIGAMQILNRLEGSFDSGDVALAQALAAQCALALSRVQLMEATVQAGRLRRELELAREVQQGTLPAAMPAVPGYQAFGCFKPADLTGGDTFDLALSARGLLLLLADATGHGIAPALDVTQMHAMLRIALRLGTPLDEAVRQLNNQLADTLPGDRFVTAFIGLLDPASHRLQYHSAGQAPLLLHRAATGACESLPPTSFPLAALPLDTIAPASEVVLAPGDILALLSDGVYEYERADGVQFGTERVSRLLAEHAGEGAEALASRLLDALAQFAEGAPQQDDITVVLLRRDPAATEARHSLPRRLEGLTDAFAATREFGAAHGVDPGLLGTLDFVIEELFTNMVKYSPSPSMAVDLVLAIESGAVKVELTDYDVEPFDVTAAPDAAVDRPLEDREPGGLGLHLVRRLVDGIDYDYDTQARRSRIRFHKKPGPPG